jgi:DNA mismatch endonuclease, patch repair protein
MEPVPKSARSHLMASVRQKHTKPELLLRRELHQLGFRYRLHVRQLPGSPDLVFPKHNAVIFVNGCFWHDHAGCRFATKPKTRVEFWKSKFEIASIWWTEDRVIHEAPGTHGCLPPVRVAVGGRELCE